MIGIDGLLKALSDGGWHSGEELGAVLNISRTAVWKQVKKLTDLGVGFESVKGKGYRIPGGLNLLDRGLVISLLSDSAAPLCASLDVLLDCQSTNLLARELPADKAGGSVLIAERQTAGRGRRGKHWVSPFGRNVYLSIVWGFEAGAAALEGLSLAVGVAVSRALAENGASDIQLKWPNDVLWQGKKLGGILLEVMGDPVGHCQVIVGIGINVGMTVESQDIIDQPWVELEQIVGCKIDRNRIAAAVVSEVLPLLACYEDRGFSAFRQEWQGLDAFAGQAVELVAGSKTISGVARGVSGNGALLLEQVAEGDGPGHISEYSGGEISLRRKK